MMPAVAPNDSRKPASRHADRDRGDTEDRGDGDDIQRRATVIDDHRAQKDHRGRDGARHRRRTAGDLARRTAG